MRQAQRELRGLQVVRDLQEPWAQLVTPVRAGQLVRRVRLDLREPLAVRGLLALLAPVCSPSSN